MPQFRYAEHLHNNGIMMLFKPSPGQRPQGGTSEEEQEEEEEEEEEGENEEEEQ